MDFVEKSVRGEQLFHSLGIKIKGKYNSIYFYVFYA